jgi:hypothetical protein
MHLVYVDFLKKYVSYVRQTAYLYPIGYVTTEWFDGPSAIQKSIRKEINSAQ